MAFDFSARINLETNADKIAEVYLAALRRIAAATKQDMGKLQQNPAVQKSMFNFSEISGSALGKPAEQIKILLAELEKLSKIPGVPKDFAAGLTREMQQVIGLSQPYITALRQAAAAGNDFAKSLLQASTGQAGHPQFGAPPRPAGGWANAGAGGGGGFGAPPVPPGGWNNYFGAQYGMPPTPPGGWNNYFGGQYGGGGGGGGGGGTGGGGGGGGAGAGFGGGRGTLGQQIANTARISLLYGTMYNALFGIENFLSNAVQSFSEFQIALQELAESAGVSVAEARTMAESITDIGAAFGAAATDALRVAIQARGVNPEGGEQFVQQAVRTASQLALITGQSAAEIGQSLNGLTVAFDTSQKVIGDASTYFNKKYGVLAPTLAGEARVAPLAAQAGLKPEELSAIFSDLSAKLAESPDAMAASLTQVLSRPDLVDLTAFGATAGKSFADQVEEVGKKFDSMSKQTQNELIFQFGRGKSGQAALQLFKDFPAIRQQVATAGPQIAGKAQELAEARMRTFSGAMQHLQVQVANLANSIGQAGLLTPLAGFIFALTEIVDLFNSMLGPLTRMPEAFKTIIGAAVDLAIALRIAAALSRAGAFGSAIKGAAGSGGIAGLAGAAGVARTGITRWVAGLSTASRFMGLFGIGVSAALLGVNAWQEANQAQKDAIDSFTDSLGKTGATTKDMADAAAASAEALENQSAITRAVTSGERDRLRTTEDVLRSISEIQPTKPSAELAPTVRILEAGGTVDAALSALEKMGVTGTEAFRRLSLAAATAEGKVEGAPGEGLFERQKAGLAKIFGEAIATKGVSLEAPKPSPPAAQFGVTRPKGTAPAEGWLPVPAAEITGKTKAEMEAEQKKALQAAIDLATADILALVSKGGVLTETQLSAIADNVLRAIGIDKDDPKFDEMHDNLVEKIIGALNEAGKSSVLVSDAVAKVLNEWGPKIEAAKNDAARSAALFSNKAVGKNQSFSPAEAVKAFESLGRGDTSMLQPDSLVAAQMGKIKGLEAVIANVKAAGEWQKLEELNADLSTAQKELADALIDPALAFLQAAFGDLTTKDKSKAEINKMVSAISALIPKIYSSGDAMAKLVGLLDSQTRALLRAKLESNIKIARAAMQSGVELAYASYTSTIASLRAATTKAYGDTRGRGQSPTEVKEIQDAYTDYLNRVKAAGEDLAEKQAALAAFDRAIASAPTGPGTEKADKAPKEKAPKKLDTAAQIAAAKALAEATRVADPVRIAQAQLQVAMADLDAIAADTENGGKNSVAYYNALAGVYQAQQNLASTIVQAAHQVRLLGVDLTDPVAQARAEYQLAVDSLNSLMAQGLSENALNPAKVDVRQKEAALQAAQFQQLFGDLQTNESLKRISHQEFIRSIQAERDRLAAQRSLLSASSNMYRQLTDEINQLDQALMEASESMNTMFNLGDIKVPTVYEVRRFMDSAFEGLNFLAAGMDQHMKGAGALAPAAAQVGAVDNRNVVININGGDLDAVQAAVMDAAGVDQQVVGARPHKF